MTYVITFGPLGREEELSCETSSQALSITLDLVERKAVGVTVASFEIGEAAVEMLRILSDYERGDVLLAEAG